MDFLAFSIVGKLILAFDRLGSTDKLALAEYGGLLIHSKRLVDMGSSLNILLCVFRFADERDTDCITYALLCILGKMIQSHDQL